ncbi:MAG: site-specific integrase [Thermoleophilaceae bacterium]|nr:site-specific integrase [Thermoleophilaceae bacterium]
MHYLEHATDRDTREIAATTTLSPAARHRSVARWRQLVASGEAGSTGERPSAERPLEPREVERLRGETGARDATIVSLLAYAGLRPGELLALRWRDVRRTAIRVDGRAQSIREHTSVGTIREVGMLRPLSADLAGWRTRGGATDDELVIPGQDDRPWSESEWADWRRQVFRPAAKRTGLAPTTRPYDLRHTFAWLRLREGASMAEVALETGYSPMTALEMYRPLADRARRAGLRLPCEAIAVARTT